MTSCSVSDHAADASITKPKHILSSKDSTRVIHGTEARDYHNHLLHLSRRNIDGPRNRLGLVISNKNFRLAFDRNRIKRVTREFFRTLPESEPPMDVVLLARRGIGQLDNAALSSLLQQQWLKMSRHASKLDSNTVQES